MNGSGDVTDTAQAVPRTEECSLQRVCISPPPFDPSRPSLVDLKLTYSTRSTWSTSHLPPQHSFSTTAKTTAIEVTSAPEERRSHTGSKRPGRAIQ